MQGAGTGQSRAEHGVCRRAVDACVTTWWLQRNALALLAVAATQQFVVLRFHRVLVQVAQVQVYQGLLRSIQMPEAQHGAPNVLVCG